MRFDRNRGNLHYGEAWLLMTLRSNGTVYQSSYWRMQAVCQNLKNLGATIGCCTVQTVARRLFGVCGTSYWAGEKCGFLDGRRLSGGLGDGAAEAVYESVGSISLEEMGRQGRGVVEFNDHGALFGDGDVSIEKRRLGGDL